MTISHRDAMQEAPNKTGALHVTAEGKPDRTQAAPVSVHICPPRRMSCSTCGVMWSSPRIQAGSIHKACTASPNGRFGMPPMTSVGKKCLG
jgi:hypothetical protein